MNRLRKILSIVVFVAMPTIGAIAQPHEYRFTFEVDSRAELDKLSQMISIDRVEGSQVWAYANQQEMERFRLTGISYNLLPDKSVAKASAPMATTVAQMQNIDRYPTYEVYDSLMRNFVHDYPRLCRLEVVTTLASGRQILALKISNKVDLDNTTKPEVLCTATMHGDEGICATTALSFCNHLLSNYGTDNRINRLLDSIEFWVIPIANPDGMYKGGNSTISESTRSNGSGTDLNRNFPKVSGGGNTLQPETKAMMEFFGKHHFSMSTNLHGGNECFNYPWDTWSRQTADNDWWRLVGAAYRDTAQYYGSSGYFDDGCSNSANGLTNGYAWYSISGGQQDWANYFAHCREVTIEVCGTKEPTSTTTIANIWKYNKNALLNFYAESLNGVRGTVTNAAGTPLAARITIEGHDVDNSWIETDSRAGDYHRYLKAGTYNLTFEADGYLPRTVTATVVDGQPTWLDVQLYGVTPNLLVSVDSIIAALPSGSRTQRTFTISNVGGTENAYTLTSDADEWLSFSRLSNDMAVDQTDTLTVMFNSHKLEPGCFWANAVFESVSQTVTVKFKLEVNNNPVDVSIATLPWKLSYFVGDTLDTDGGTLNVRFCNDSTAVWPITSVMVRNFNSATAGIKMLKVSAGTLETSFNIVVRDSMVPPQEVELLNFTIISLPQKRTYYVGDTLDVTGGLIAATYTDGSIDTLPITADMVRGFSSRKAGRLLLTVKTDLATSAFYVEVLALPVDSVTITSVTLTSLPLKLEYKVGQSLDVSGGLLTVTYSNDSTATVALQLSMVSGFDSEKTGLQLVMVEYENTVNIFSVNVVANSPDDTTGIAIQVCEPIIYTIGRTIVVGNATEKVSVYDAMGRIVTMRTSATTITVAKPGIYIVKVGKTVKRVMVY